MNRSRFTLKLAMLGLLSLLVACAASEVRPVELLPEDVCAACKMALSERQFAAEYVTRDGDARKYDDLGCLLDDVKEKQPQNVAAYFVMDFNTKQWVNAHDAHFVRSAEIKSPMGGGVIAFKEQARAAEAAAQFKGAQVRFGDLLKQ
jgi:copper chaperone NosL